MNYNIVTAPTFLKELKHLSKKYRSLKKDLMNLQEELINNPETGTDLGRGIRKIRTEQDSISITEIEHLIKENNLRIKE